MKSREREMAFIGLLLKAKYHTSFFHTTVKYKRCHHLVFLDAETVT